MAIFNRGATCSKWWSQVQLRSAIPSLPWRMVLVLPKRRQVGSKLCQLLCKAAWSRNIVVGTKHLCLLKLHTAESRAASGLCLAHEEVEHILVFERLLHRSNSSFEKLPDCLAVPNSVYVGSQQFLLQHSRSCLSAQEQGLTRHCDTSFDTELVNCPTNRSSHPAKHSGCPTSLRFWCVKVV